MKSLALLGVGILAACGGSSSSTPLDAANGIADGREASDGNGGGFSPCVMPPACVGTDCPVILEAGDDPSRWWRWAEADDSEVVFSQRSSIFRWSEGDGMAALAEPVLASGTRMSNLALGADEVFRTEDDRLVAYAKVDGAARTVLSGLVYYQGSDITPPPTISLWVPGDGLGLFVFSTDGSAERVNTTTGERLALLPPGSVAPAAPVTYAGVRVWIVVTDTGFVYTRADGGIGEVDGTTVSTLVEAADTYGEAGPTLAVNSDALFWVGGGLRTAARDGSAPHAMFPDDGDRGVYERAFATADQTWLMTTEGLATLDPTAGAVPSISLTMLSDNWRTGPFAFSDGFVVWGPGVGSGGAACGLARAALPTE